MPNRDAPGGNFGTTCLTMRAGVTRPEGDASESVSGCRLEKFTRRAEGGEIALGHGRRDFLGDIPIPERLVDFSEAGVCQRFVRQCSGQRRVVGSAGAKLIDHRGEDLVGDFQRIGVIPGPKSGRALIDFISPIAAFAADAVPRNPDKSSDEHSVCVC